MPSESLNTYNRIAYRAVGSILLLDRRVADNIK